MKEEGKIHGLPSLSKSVLFCSSCCRGKQSRSSKPRILPPRPGGLVRKVATRAQQPLELLHTDICGSLSSKSLSGSRYILTITDNFSRFSWLYFLKRKSETLVKFKQFKSMIELQTSHRIKAIRSDNGGEYISQDFIRFCDESGIMRQLTQTYTSHQNGMAERKNRTLPYKARCMAFASGISDHLWTEAVATANYVTNRTSTKANNGVTSFERLIGKVPVVDHLCVFGCRSFVRNNSPKRKKWAPRSTECIFLGYDAVSRGFRNYHRPSRKIFVSKDVRFDELTFPCVQASAASPSQPSANIN